jgi:hypothetical protein
MEPSGISPPENRARVDAGQDGGLIGRHHVDPLVTVSAPLESTSVGAENYVSVDFECDFSACFHGLVFGDFLQ